MIESVPRINSPEVDEYSLSALALDDRLSENCTSLTVHEKQLVENNLGLVGFLVKKIKYDPRGVYSKEDLYQEGSLALIHSAQNYNQELGNQFSSYASKNIAGTTFRYVKRNSSFIWIPENIWHAQKDYIDISSRLTQELSGDATLGDVTSSGYSFKKETIMLAEAKSDSISGLENLIGSNKTRGGKKIIAEALTADLFSFEETSDEKIDNQKSVKNLIQNAELNPRETEAIKLRFRLGAAPALGQQALQELSEVGKKLDITGERARQIIVMAMKKLKLAAGVTDEK